MDSGWKAANPVVVSGWALNAPVRTEKFEWESRTVGAYSREDCVEPDHIMNDKSGFWLDSLPVEAVAGFDWGHKEY